MPLQKQREEKIQLFLEMVKESDNIVFFGGAGVSTESGIPDFRSVDGLYNQEYAGSRRSSTAFTATRCSAWMRSPIWRTRSWRS